MSRPISSYVGGLFPVSQQVTSVLMIKEGIGQINFANKLLDNYKTMNEQLNSHNSKGELIEKECRFDLNFYSDETKSAEANKANGWRTIFDGLLTFLPIIGTIYTAAMWIFAKKEIVIKTNFEKKSSSLSDELIEAIKERKQAIIKEKRELLKIQRFNLQTPSDEKMEEAAAKIAIQLEDLNLEWEALDNKLDTNDALKTEFKSTNEEIMKLTEQNKDLQVQLALEKRDFVVQDINELQESIDAIEQQQLNNPTDEKLIEESISLREQLDKLQSEYEQLNEQLKDHPIIPQTLKSAAVISDEDL